MREVLDDAARAWAADEPFALASVVRTWRSAPRPPGAAMLVRADGRVTGSVSGGCVEGAVYELAQRVLATGVPVSQRYGVSDDDALAVGLTCGGVIEVFVERVDRASHPQFATVLRAVAEGTPVAWCRVVDHPDPSFVGRGLVLTAPAGPDGAQPQGSPAQGSHSQGSHAQGSLGSPRLDDAVTADGAGLLGVGRSQVLTYGPDGERLGIESQVFVTAVAARPRMIVFGAVDFAAAVARIGAFLGYRVTVCDARATFATDRRFPDADEVVVRWPHRYLRAEQEGGRIDAHTVIAVLTHDPKFDVPLLSEALRLPALGYLGAMGSRRTHQDRLRRLAELGFTAEQLARIHSPIGLDLGGRTPEETAVSIAAEIVAERWGGGGRRLGETDGPIHHEVDD